VNVRADFDSFMKVQPNLLRLVDHDRVNFWLTNRLPRRLATRFFGWFSRIEQPWIRDLSIAAWRAFADLDLSDALQTSFKSLHDCFIRELVPGARHIEHDDRVAVSPCDAVVGSCGTVAGITAFQAKGSAYPLVDLLTSPELAERVRDGCYVTLRLKSSMYHRFHAPYACRVRRITYVGGDVWNVNPPALARVERLYCKNERAVVEASLGGPFDQQPFLMVAVGAILVGSIRFRFPDSRRRRRRSGQDVIGCDARLHKGEEMGWFEHGSTIIVFAPRGFALCTGVSPGQRIRMGAPLLKLPHRVGPRP
jgi:phosphatidylserine decarboxylase